MTGHMWAARAVSVDTARRVIEALVIPYGETARVTDDGRTFYDETFESGGAIPGERVAVFGGHKVTATGVDRGPLIGRADTWTDTPEGLRAVLTIANTAAGTEVLELADVLGTVHVSAEYRAPRRYQPGEDVRRNKAEPVTLDGVAVILPPHRPAFAGAAGAARTDTEENTMTDTDTTPEEETAPEETAPEESVRALVTTEVRREVARMNVGGGRTAARARSPFDRFRSFDELRTAARAATPEGVELSRQFAAAYTAHRTAARVWTNQITADNPGVMPPAWLTEVFGIVDRGRPSITALGGPRTAGGMDVYWPYYNGDLTTIVGEQVAQKTEITSVKVSFLRGQATLKTYAGGSDVAFQLQRHSSPSYMSLYDRILQIAYGITTENAFIDALVAGAGHTLVLDPVTAPLGDVKKFLFAASAHVRTVTGTPATAVLVSSDVFEAWGAFDNLWPTQYGTSNTAGTADAATLQISINGLPITEAPMAPAGTVLVTNESAAAWLEEGPFLIAAPDVPKLGTDVAIWGEGAPGLFLPAGITKAAAAAATKK